MFYLRRDETSGVHDEIDRILRKVERADCITLLTHGMGWSARGGCSITTLHRLGVCCTFIALTFMPHVIGLILCTEDQESHRGDKGLQDKAAQRTRVIFELGMLLAPVYDLTKTMPPPASADYRIASAKLHRDVSNFIREEIIRFSRFNTIEFGRERNDISNTLYGLANLLNRLPNNTTDDDRTNQLALRESIEATKRQVLELIDQIPIDWTSVIFQEATPFSTHLRIYDAIRTAKRWIHYFDRYLDADFYPLYLRDVDRSLEIRLVTTKGTQNYGVTNVVAISRVAQQEFANYQLIQCAQSILHDRNLRIDDRIFHLGSSIKDAGKYATNFAVADNTAQAHQILDDLIKKGTVI